MEVLPYQLGPYLLIEKVGQGGFANVYLALRQKRPFLIKILKKEKAQSQASVRDFVREVRIGSYLDHPNAVSFVDSGKIDDTYFAAMEVTVGADLNTLMQDFAAKGQNCPLPLTLFVIRKLSDVIAYLHRTTVYEFSDSVLFHGDISPENVLIGEEGQVKLMDFGSAGQKSFSDRGNKHYGKLGYLPIEVTQSQAFEPSTDVYSLAVVAFYLLFGRKPFEGKSKHELLDAIREQDVPRLDCSDLVKARQDEMTLRILFNKALHKNPALRFHDVNSFADAFFSVQFRKPAIENEKEAASLFSPTFTQSLRNLRMFWFEQIDRFRQASAKASFAGDLDANVKVENILALEEVRKFPRIKVHRDKITADVINAKMRFKSTFSVQEMSQGGLLMQWEALPSQPGMSYPLQLHMGKGSGPISARGEVRYEISRHSSLYVGFQFQEISDEAIEQIQEYVGRKLGTLHQVSKNPDGNDPVADKDANVIEVIFKSSMEWKKEFEQNVRHGGMFIRTNEPHKQDETVVLRIRLPHQTQEFLVKGKVVLCQGLENMSENDRRRHGVAVELDLTEEQLRAMNQSL